MSTTDAIDQLYEQYIKPLSSPDRLRLLALLAKDAAMIVREETNQPAKMTITERLAQAQYSGGRLFKNAEEVDDYIRQERESWER